MECTQQALQTLEFDKVRAHIAERTVSAMGRQEIETLSPTDDPERISRRLKPVLECMDLIAFGQPLSIRNIPDIRPALGAGAVPGAILHIPELLSIAEILEGSRRLLSYMLEHREKYPRLWELTGLLNAFPELEEAFSRALDPVTERVKDSASTALRRIRRGIESLRTRIREQVETILNKLPDNVVQDRLVTIRGVRFVIPIRENQVGRMQGLVHDQSASGATLFVEPMATVEMNNQLRKLELAERQEIERILQHLTAQVAEVGDALRDNLDILAQFDAIYAKASFSRDLDGTEPLFNTHGQIALRGARHPLLVYRVRAEDNPESLVPLNLNLGAEDCRTMILTGPNAGGKTVALKTVGILALMVHAGLPIPAQPRSE